MEKDIPNVYTYDCSENKCGLIVKVFALCCSQKEILKTAVFVNSQFIVQEKYIT